MSAEKPPTLKLPDHIQKRLTSLQQEINQIISGAETLLTTRLPDPIAFEFANSAPRDILTFEERAQSISFVTRFEYLPSDCEVHIIEKNRAYYIENMKFLRHALNEFRPLIQNEKDSVYYQNIHGVWYGMLTLDDASKGTTIRAIDTKRNDVTSIYTRWLSERNKAISFVLHPLDYDYLYNGILQHSDSKYSERFVKDYVSGELNYILWKHVHILGFIREMLRPYCLLISALTSPRPGPL